MDRKPYAPPTLTDHGNAVEKTKGYTGKYWEYYGTSHGIILPPPDDPDDPAE